MTNLLLAEYRNPITKGRLRLTACDVTINDRPPVGVYELTYMSYVGDNTWEACTTEMFVDGERARKAFDIRKNGACADPSGIDADFEDDNDLYLKASARTMPEREVTSSRYRVGEEYLFVREMYDAEEMCFSYHPSRCTNLRLATVVVRCESMHVVPAEYGDSQHIGYRFVDIGSDVMWDNQYPVAAYGQLDMSLDFAITTEAMAGFYNYTDVTQILQRVERLIRGRGPNDVQMEDNDIRSYTEYQTRLHGLVETVLGKKVEYRPLVMTNRHTGEAHSFPHLPKAHLV